MKKLKDKLKKFFISYIDSSLYILHGYELNKHEVEKALPESFNNEKLCTCQIYALTNKKVSTYFFEDKSSPNVQMMRPELVEKDFNTFNVLLNYDTNVIKYISLCFSSRELLKLSAFLFRNRIKRWFNINLATLALIVAMITSVISIILGIKNLDTSQKINIKVQIEQTIPQSQSEPLTPKNSTVVVPMEIL